jgi:spermidine/putrescine transport system ATP-binding protein/putrescine transport system ATP-binding protein
MQIELRALQKSIGITFVFVTHDQEEALSMSDRVAVMSGGRILQVAPPRVLYEAPNCREVADFIGQRNFFTARVIAREGGLARVDLGPLGKTSLAVPADGDILIALRPEKIALSAEAQTNNVEGRISAVAYLGERSHYTVAVAGVNEPIFVSGQNASQAIKHAPGDVVFLSWSAADLVVLPAR